VCHGVALARWRHGTVPGCSWRGWTFLLLFVDLLVISQLNLCERLSPSSIENPGGDHLSASAQLYFGLVSTITYVGDPAQGLSCLCKRGAIITVGRYYSFRAVELVLMVLGWQLGVDSLTVSSPADARTCYDQIYLLVMAGLCVVLTAVSAPMAYRSDPRGRSVPAVGVDTGGRGGGRATEMEDLFAKNAWESDSEGEGEGRPSSSVKPPPPPPAPRSALPAPGGGGGGGAGQGRLASAGPKDFGETMSSVGWVAWESTDIGVALAADNGGAPTRSRDGVRSTRGSYRGE
jgi:hypothetical protein